MQIWVDADACPGEIKELLFRTAQRIKVPLTLVANQSMRVPPSEFIRTELVSDGANVADRRIVELVAPGDLVVTADIPLAADVVAKGVRRSTRGVDSIPTPTLANDSPSGICSTNCAAADISAVVPRTSAPKTARRSPTNSTAGWRRTSNVPHRANLCRLIFKSVAALPIHENRANVLVVELDCAGRLIPCRDACLG